MSEIKLTKKPRTIMWLTILAFVFFILGFWFWKYKSASAVVYKEIQVKKGDLRVTILSTGTVQPENRLEIKPPIAGRVETVKVVEGQKVKKGQLLALMSSTERAALVDAARGQGKAELQRWEQMYRPTPVLAPIDGTIILRNVESGQSFSSTDAILVMSDRLTVKAQVDETDISQIKLHQGAEIVLDAYPNQKMSAKVDQVAYDAKTVNNVTTYIVDVLPDSTPEYMRSGMTANVNFFLDAKEGVLMVSSDAVKTQDGKSTVLIRDDGGHPVEREVEIGITDGKRIEIVSGLSEGDTVLSAQVRPKDKDKNGSNPFNPMGGGKRPKK